MKELFRKSRSSMAVSIIGAIVILLAVFGIVVSTIGIAAFTNAFNKEYSTTTYHMAATAAEQVDGDHIDDYLRGDPDFRQQHRM